MSTAWPSQRLWKKHRNGPIDDREHPISGSVDIDARLGHSNGETVGGMWWTEGGRG